jgi:LysM repeat protein
MLSRSTAPRRLSAAVTAGALSAVVLSTLIGPAAHAAPAAVQAAPPATASAFVPVIVPAAPSAAVYTVKPGDTLSGIAAAHGVSLASVFATNNMGMATIIYPGQAIKVDGAAAPAAKPAEAPAPASAAGSYTVRPGDTLSRIAAVHGVSLASVLAANNLEMRSIIYPGQTIKLAATSAPAPAPVATPAPAPAPKPAAPAPAAGSYVVKAGDTLSRVASAHGVSLAAVLAANNLEMRSIIYPGQTIKLSGAATSAPAPAPAAPAPAPKPATPTRISFATVKQMVADTARSMGVEVSLALAIAEQESGFRQHVVSSAGAIGTMQVMPTSGKWASDLVGRTLDLNIAQDNITAGVAIIRSLVKTSPSLEIAIASYYQGQYSVLNRGMYDDTKVYVAQVLKRQQSFQ